MGYRKPEQFAFGAYAQRRFELSAWHVHEVADGHFVFGDGGAEVMRVIKPSSRHGKGGVYFLNAETGDGWGNEFKYSDYFLPEEMGVQR